MTAPFTVVHLRGSEVEMGRQHGAIVAHQGGRPELIDFYPGMAGRLLSLRSPNAHRRALRGVFQPFLSASAARLHKARLNRFPELAARAEAGLVASGHGTKLLRWLTVMDVFQNTIGRLASLRVPQLTGLRLTGIPMCSSLAVWGDASVDGTLRHARNFDFPGIGVWDAHPSVVFCSPDDGLRYGYVTSLGVDLPGITGFNEAGLTLTAHTRMHVDIDPDGTCIADLGHQIIRRARTVGEAVDIAQKVGASSTWGLLVSSASERDAVLIETTGAAVRTTSAGAAHHLACTNRYRNPELARKEVLTSAAFAVDSDARFETLQRAAGKGGLTAADLRELLATCEDPNAAPGCTADRVAGSCISSPLTVKSVVVEPEAGRIQVASGRAPVARGPWETVEWDWSGATGVQERRGVAAEAPATPLDAALLSYVEAARRDLDGESAGVVRAHLHAAALAAPNEPSLQFLGAMGALGERKLDLAGSRLTQALEVESAPWRRATLLRWAAKVAEAQGRRAEARHHRSAIAHLGPQAVPVHALLDADRKRPATASSLSRVVPDLLLVDA